MRYADCVANCVADCVACIPSLRNRSPTVRIDIDIEPPVASSLNQHPTLRPCTLMDVLNGLHTELDPASQSQQACQSTSESQILPTTIVRLIPFRHNPLLLYPTGRYQQSIGTSTDYVSVGDKWFITSPYLQSLDMLRNWSASRLQSLIGAPTDRSLCHAFVALSDRWISTPPLGLFTNANDNHIPMCAYGYTHRKGRPVRRHAKASTCYEIGQQADYNH